MRGKRDLESRYGRLNAGMVGAWRRQTRGSLVISASRSRWRRKVKGVSFLGFWFGQLDGQQSHSPKWAVLEVGERQGQFKSIEREEYMDIEVMLSGCQIAFSSRGVWDGGRIGNHQPIMAAGIGGSEKSALSERERNLSRDRRPHILPLLSLSFVVPILDVTQRTHPTCFLITWHGAWWGRSKGKRERKKEKMEKDMSKSHGRGAWKWRSSVIPAQRVTSFDPLSAGLTVRM